MAPISPIASAERDVVGSDGHARECGPGCGADGGDHCWRGGDDRRLADALGPEGRPWLRLLDQRGNDFGHVERGRDEVVGEGRVAGPPLEQEQLFHDRQADPLGDAAFDLPGHLQRVEGAADVLRRSHLDHPHQAEVGVDVDDRPMRGTGQ